MGRKADKREARAASAKARDIELFQAATHDERNIRYVASLDESRFQTVQNRALEDVRRPMSRHRKEALAVLGAMASVMQSRNQAAIQPRPALRPGYGD